jgi:hypothetical protein
MTRTERCGRPCADGHPCQAISARGGRGCALHYQPREKENTVNATERHAALVAAGWRSRIDGKWISPDPEDARYAFTFDAAWHEHQSRQADAHTPSTP